MINQKIIEKTGEIRNYPIKGRMQNLEIYTIPLTELKFNIQNGRIASYISQYQESHDEIPEEYNDIIEKFIVESNQNAFKKTKDNIRRFGQLEPAIVLTNGVVIDGNRRFSVLRQLAREGEDSKFQYIKAAILEVDSFTPKEIKRFELNLQHGREERVDYNAIDYLVDIYRDLVGNSAEFKPEEYAQETVTTVSKVKTDMRKAQLMVEYLEYINKPLKFHIARDLKLDGPLDEMVKILKSNKIDPSNTDEIKEFLFYNLSIVKGGDISRIIRDFRPIVEDTEKLNSAIEEAEENMDDLHDYFQSESYESDGSTFAIPETMREPWWEKSSELLESVKLENAQYKPVKTISLAYNHLKTIDIEAARRMNIEDIDTFKQYIEKVIEISNQFKDQVNVN